EPGGPTDGPRRLKMLKSNLCSFPEALGFDTDENAVMWIPLPEDADLRTEAAKADEFLRGLCSPGKSMLQTDVAERTTKAGLRWATVRRSKERLKIVSKRQTKEEGWRWEWRWPGPVGV